MAKKLLKLQKPGSRVTQELKIVKRALQDLDAQLKCKKYIINIINEMEMKKENFNHDDETVDSTSNHSELALTSAKKLKRNQEGELKKEHIWVLDLGASIDMTGVKNG